jgi:hypothetical protein
MKGHAIQVWLAELRRTRWVSWIPFVGKRSSPSASTELRTWLKQAYRDSLSLPTSRLYAPWVVSKSGLADLLTQMDSVIGAGYLPLPLLPREFGSPSRRSVIWGFN